jgi:hypothetical protein
MITAYIAVRDYDKLQAVLFLPHSENPDSSRVIQSGFFFYVMNKRLKKQVEQLSEFQ